MKSGNHRIQAIRRKLQLTYQSIRRAIVAPWVRLSISQKFLPAFGALVLLILIVATIGLFSLRTVKRETEAAIISSVQIQRQVFEMDNTLQKARQIERDFFLRWSTTGYLENTQEYVDLHSTQINQVLDISGRLQELLASQKVSVALRRTHPEVVSYIELVKRYSRSFNESVGLVNSLSMEESGVIYQLQLNSSLLRDKLQLSRDPELMNLLSQLQLAEKEYLLTRQPAERENLNTVSDRLKNAIALSPRLNADRKTDAITYLNKYLAIAEQVSELDREIRERIVNFDDQAYLFSNRLIELANDEIQRAKDEIVLTSYWFGYLLLGAMVGALFLAIIIANVFRSALYQLEIEQEKSESLLRNILPVPIAERLKQQEKTIADDFAEVTVLFADLVGFTQLSAAATPTEVVQLLNQIFSSFDYLAEKYDLEKIKTIGDAYMVVGGLPTAREDHAEAIANMALEMQLSISQFNIQQAQRYPKPSPFLQIRIGINTGPVVAGVIGVKKFIYDLWGDTVNIASRMESHGIAGCIQVTEATYRNLQGKYRFKKRGVIDVKGKGEMTVYILVGPKTSPKKTVEYPKISE